MILYDGLFFFRAFAGLNVNILIEKLFIESGGFT